MARESLEKRRAVVTGGSSGLGVDFARELAARGCLLVLVARRQDKLRQVADELTAAHGVETEVISLDLTDPGAPEALFRQATADGRPVEILVNNAGFGVYGDYLDLEWEREGAMIDLDVRAVAHLTRLFATHMVERGFGRILQVSSIGAYQPTPTYASYAAAKAFVLDFGEAVDYELKGTGVRVTTVSPGVTATEFLEVAGQEPTLYQRLMMMESPEVARIGIRALEKGKRTVVPGWLNAMGAVTMRLLPRRLSTRIAHWTMKGG